MSDGGRGWHSRISCLLLHPTEPLAWVVREGDGWALPHVTVPYRLWFPMVSPLSGCVQAQLGLDATVLRCVRIGTDEQDQIRDLAYVLEMHAPLPESDADGRWCDLPGLASLSWWASKEHDLLAAALADDAGTAIPALRPPWSRRGWWTAATGWIQEQLAAIGAAPATVFEQVKIWDLSCVLRIIADSQEFFFKALPSGPAEAATRPLLFAHEPRLLADLGPRFPDALPIPLAIDADRAWMLLADLGYDLRAQTAITPWFESIAAFARLQVAASEQIDTLRAAGCLDRQLPILADQIPQFVDDQAMQAIISDDDLARLRALSPRLQQMCAQLQGYPIPSSLVHGDLNPGNVAYTHGRPVIFDWTDGCIAHPFLDLAPFLDEAAEKAGRTDAYAAFRDHYLAHWATFAPLPALRAAFVLADPLGAMHQLISYQHILAHVEPLSYAALCQDLRFFLKKLLKTMA